MLLVFWSAAAWAVPPSIQTLVLARAGAGDAAQAMAVNSSAVYIGAALGGALGGAALAADPGFVPLAAATPVLLSTFVMVPVLRLGARGAAGPVTAGPATGGAMGAGRSEAGPAAAGKRGADG